MKRVITAADGLSARQRTKIAKTTTNPRELQRLAYDRSKAARLAVAKNENCPQSVLSYLADDEDQRLRREVAERTNGPQLLAKLADKDSDLWQSKSTPEWPTKEEIQNINLENEDMEEFWQTYLCDPEERVFEEFQIFAEPSVQGMMGGMFLIDESGEDNESIHINFREWCENELDMALEARSSKDYYRLFYNYVEGLVEQHWA